MNFELNNTIRMLNKYANVDALYGPYESTASAILATKMIAKIGLTVGVIQDSVIEEYWWIDDPASIVDDSYDNIFVRKISKDAPTLSYTDECPEGSTLKYEVGERIIIPIRFTSPNYGKCQITVLKNGTTLKVITSDKGYISVDVDTAVTEGTFIYSFTALDAFQIPAEQILTFKVVVGGVNVSSNFLQILNNGINTASDITITYNASCADTTKTIKVYGELLDDNGDIVDGKTWHDNNPGSTSTYIITEHEWHLGTVLQWGEYTLNLYAYTGSSPFTDSDEDLSKKISYNFFILDSDDFVLTSPVTERSLDTNTELVIPFTIQSGGDNTALRARGDLYPATSSWEIDGDPIDGYSLDRYNVRINNEAYWSLGKIITPGTYIILMYAISNGGAPAPHEHNIQQIRVTVTQHSSSYIIEQDGLIALFTADGKSNDNDNDKRGVWSNDLTGSNLYFELHDLNYSTNGWISDESGEKTLKMNGESYGILKNGNSEYNPISNINIWESGFTAEIIYRTRCIGELNAKVITGHVGAGTNSTGFSTSYDKISIGSTSALLTYDTSEGEWIHATLVIDKQVHTDVEDVQDYAPRPLITIYVNGAMCSSMILTNNMIFDNISNKVLLNCAYNTLDDKMDYFGSCEIKAIRFYNRALRASQVVNNYVASILNETKRLQIDGRNGDVLPTVKFINMNDLYGITPSESASGVELVSFSLLNNITVKSDLKKKYVHASIIYKDVDGTESNWPYAIIQTQGTSSLAYPVKNYKITLYKDTTFNKKQKTDAFVDKGWSEENKFTLKCDYMEAAHLNNTPSCIFYNELIDSLVETGDIKDGWNEEHTVYTASNDERTPSRRDGHFDAIKGFPCVVTYYESESAYARDEGVYVGTYMFNIDKSGSSLGFDSPAKLASDGETVVQITNPRDGEETIDNAMQSFEGVANKSNSAGCFFSFEDYRASAYRDDYCAGVYQQYIESHPDYTGTLDEFIEEFAGTDILLREEDYQIPYRNEYDYFAADYEARYDWDDLEEGGEEFWGNSSWGLKRMIDWVSSASKNLTTFYNEFSNYFDLQYCIIYYLLMIVFGQVDNAGKNSMWDTWDGLVWRPRPYDLDTAIGLDNSGFEIIKEDAELIRELSPFKNIRNEQESDNLMYSLDVSDTANSRYASYNTRTSRFWISFAKAFKTEIEATYSRLRSIGVYTMDNIISKFLGNTSDIIGEAYYNRDMTTKFYKLSDIETYISRMHGNRVLKFKSWMNKRLTFCDTLFNYSNDTDSYNTNIILRSDAYTNTPVSVMLSLLTYSPQYIKVDVGSTRDAIIEAYCSPDSEYIDPITQTKKPGLLFTIPLVAGNKEIQISGAGGIREIGNLQGLKASSLVLGGATRLTNLDLSYSTKLTALSLLNNTFLRTLYCNGATQLGTEASGAQLDLSNCENLKEVNLDNTKLTSVVFPVGGALKTISAKNCSITGITVDSCQFLSSIDVSGCENISSYSINNCPSLTTLNADNLPITRFSVANCENLETISLVGSSNITEFEIINCPKLKVLNLQNNRSSAIQTLNLTGISGQNQSTGDPNPTTLQQLDISGSSVQTVRFPSDIENTLMSFSLSGSDIRNVRYDTSSNDGVDMSRLSGLTNVSFLNCNNVQHITGFTYSGNCSNLFRACVNLEDIAGEITCTSSASAMFYNCYKLESLEDVMFDFGECASLSSAFAYCYALPLTYVKKVLDACDNTLVNIDSLCYGKKNVNYTTSEYTILPNYCFAKCKGVTSASAAFMGSSISSITTQILTDNSGNIAFLNLTDAPNMFRTSDVTTIPQNIMRYFPKIRNASQFFLGAKLTGNLSNGFFTTSNGGSSTITSAYGFFAGNSDLSINMNNMLQLLTPLTNATDLHMMFYGCTGCIGSVPEGFFSKIRSCTNIAGFFKNTRISGLPQSGSLFRVSGDTTSTLSITNAGGLFAGCTFIVDVVITSDLFSGVPNMVIIGNTPVYYASSNTTSDGLFESTGILQVGDNFFTNMPLLTNISCVFKNCTRFIGMTSGFTSNTFYNQTRLTDISQLFYGCSSLSMSNMPDLFNQSKSRITNASYLFYNCTNVTGFSDDILNNMPSLANASYVFYGCSGMDFGSASDINVFNGDVLLENVSHAFDGCNGLIGVLNNLLFDSCRNSLKNASFAFYNCTGLTGIGVGTENTIPINPTLGLFAECLNLETVQSAFSGCTHIEGSIPFDIFWTSNIERLYTKLTTCAELFYNCGFNAPTIIDGISYLFHPEMLSKLIGVTSLTRMFAKSYSVDNDSTLPKWTSTYPIHPQAFDGMYFVTTIREMFYRCRGVGGTITSGWFSNTASRLEDIYGAFAHTGLTDVSTEFLRANSQSANNRLKYVGRAFYNCASLTGTLPLMNQQNVYTKIDYSNQDNGFIGFAYNTNASNISAFTEPWLRFCNY